jgi:hypothetical protein
VWSVLDSKFQGVKQGDWLVRGSNSPLGQEKKGSKSQLIG